MDLAQRPHPKPAMANLCAIEFFGLVSLTLISKDGIDICPLYPGPTFVDDVVVVVAGFPEVTTNPDQIPDFKMLIIISSYLLSMVDRGSKNPILLQSGSVNRKENSRGSQIQIQRCHRLRQKLYVSKRSGGPPQPSGLQLELCTMTKPCTRRDDSSQSLGLDENIGLMKLRASRGLFT